MNKEEDINYQVNDFIDPDELKEVFTKSGSSRDVSNEIQLKKMVVHSKLIITERHRGNIVGVARSLTDFSSLCVLVDVAVIKSYQKQGIGKKLVKLTKDQVEDNCSLLILASKETQNYFNKFKSDSDNIYIVMLNN